MKAKLIYFILILNFTLTKALLSQSELYFERNDEINVIVNGESLLSAWAGGVNAGQISKIDLDQDGIQDIFIFDRSASRIITFLNIDNTPGNIAYKHTIDYNDRFPVMSAWCLLRDFNCDGKADIFTKAPNSIKVYENTSNEIDGLQFELREELLHSEYDYTGVPFNAPVYCVTLDIPAIADHDGDGDLDIISFSEIASTLYYYKNYAVENGDCNSLADFKLANRCYGFVSEASEDNTLFIGEDHNCDFNVVNPRSGGQHTGGTLLTLDTNDDGFQELIVADVSFNTMKMLMNGPSIQGPDSISEVITNFPSNLQNTTAIDIVNFPAAYYEDVNNDGVKDLLVCPNNPNQCDDDEGVWLYLNNGSNTLPNFEFIQTNFLQDEMIEVGRGAYPVLADFNSDGLLDLFVSNEEYYEGGPQPPSRLALFENTGTSSSPEFTLIDANYLSIDQYALGSIYPCFFDLNGDGATDLLIGDQAGKLHYFRNQAAPNESFDLVLDTPNFPDLNNVAIDVGQFAAPQAFDLDRDGKLDLLIGEKNGNINYYRNVTEGAMASFEFVEDTLGGVVASNYLGINGYSIPLFFRNTDDETRLIVGTETGVLNYYGNIDENLNGEFELISAQLNGIREGDRSAAAIGFLNDDDFPDLIYGQVGGGLAYYSGIQEPVQVFELTDENSILVYPNPAKDQVRIELKYPGGNTEIVLYDLMGRALIRQAAKTDQVVLSLESVPNGVYIVQAQYENQTSSSKLIVAK